MTRLQSLPAYAMALLCACLGSSVFAHACGFETDCIVNTGDYRIYLPDRDDTSSLIPAIVHIHGLGRSSQTTLETGEFRRLARKLNIAMVAVNGVRQSWTFPNGVQRGPIRDEAKYLQEVRADIAQRFSVDPHRIVVSGFSIGASMVWYLSCLTPSGYAGFITVAGTMWRPQPQSCRRKIENHHHYHGQRDRTFPLTGRKVRDKKQGDIFTTQEIVFRQDPCAKKIVSEERFRGMTCNRHVNCGGGEFRFCLHGGAHDLKASFLEDGFRRIAKAKNWTLAP